MDAVARETSGATTALIVRHVRKQAGETGVTRLLELAGETRTANELDDEHRWSTYEQKLALFEAAAAVLGDRHVSLHIGETALDYRVGAALRVMLRTLGSPGLVLSNVAKACPKFSTVATMAAVEVGSSEATVTYRLHDGYRPHRFDCEYNIGLLRVVGPLFGLPRLRVEHATCQVLGAPHCVYEISWPRWSRLPWRRATRRKQLRDQVLALSDQVASLQSIAADLVSTDDVDAILDRIVERASNALSATRYLLVVKEHDDAPLRVHADGMTVEEAEALAPDLYAGLLDGDTSIVREVASARRSYGRLAAFAEGSAVFPEERALLDAYARSAAAALDAATALGQARRESGRATALLGLARALASLSSADDVSRRIVEAMPAILDAACASVMLWEPASQRLVASAHHDWPAGGRAFLERMSLRRDDSPVVAEWLASPEPRLLRGGSTGPFVTPIIEALQVDDIVLVPITRNGELFGLAAAGFVGQRMPADASELVARSAAVADQAATALENARLLAEVRHVALHDDLTGLPTRRLFAEFAAGAIARADRQQGNPALLFIDLDRFKRLNDSLGHEAGDQALVQVATRLLEAVRTGDVVARLGGDEFTVLLEGVDRIEANDVADRIAAAFQQPMQVGEHVVVLPASVGLALHPDDGTTYAALLRSADRAMYRAKRSGRAALRRA